MRNCARVPRWPLPLFGTTLLLLAVTLAAATTPEAAARQLLARAVAAAQHGSLDEAFLLAERAATGQPEDSPYVAARETLRQRATLAHLERAHDFVGQHREDQAAVEFRTALALDPSNLDARQGLQAAFPLARPVQPTGTELRVRNAASPVRLEPAPGAHAFHVRQGLRQILAQVAAAYGLKAYVADQVPERTIRLDLADADFEQAMAALHDVVGVDWLPLDPHTMYFADSGQMAKLAPVAARTFYVPWVSDGVGLNEIATTLKNLLGIPQATIDLATRAINVRATPDQLDAAEQLLLDLQRPVGQVLLEIKIVEVNQTTARTLGLAEPYQFTMFALGPLLAQLQNSGNLQQNILQLFQQGGLNAVLGSGQLSPSQIAQATTALSPLLQNPFVTFGGGATLMAISVPNFAASFSATNGYVDNIETALLRAQSGQSAELKVGQRFPIVNASFSPISLSPAIAKVLGNGSFIQPFPSFTYEDLGLDAKLTPEISAAGDVRLQADITVNALTGQSSNNIPILSNRHVLTAISVKDNQPVIMAGLLDREEMASLVGLPGLSQVPGLGRLFSTETGQTTNDQLLFVVTPHIVQLPASASATTWLPASLPPPTGGSGPIPGFAPPPLIGAPGRGATIPGSGRGGGNR
ncbi:MAG TPA: type II and III secretion system protein [Terriglobales bacterium]|nr:type II and III secretion system protein [Terriglobales bacterium]